MIFNYQDAYISFTNRDAPVVNDRYRRLVSQLLPPRGRDNRQEVNLVAHAITDRLKRQNVTVFGERLDGQRTPVDVMRDHARHSLVLIQLIERGTFRDQPRNWMFEEYTAFISDTTLGDPRKQSRYLRIILDAGFQDQALLPLEYRSWLDQIRSLNAIRLASSSVDDVLSRLSDVVTVIDERRQVMLDSLILRASSGP